MVDFRMGMIRFRHWPPIRRLREWPDRLDAALVRLANRLSARALPLADRVRRLVSRAAAGLRRRTAPLGQRMRPAFRTAGKALQRVPLSVWMGLIMTGFTALPARLHAHGVKTLCALLGLLPPQLTRVPSGSVEPLFQAIFGLSSLLVVLLPAAALLAFVRHRIGHWAIKAGVAGFLALALLLARAGVSVPAWLNEANPDQFSNLVRNELWVMAGWRLFPWVLAAAAAAVAVARRPTALFYGSARDADGWADRVWTNLRTHGGDPLFRRRLYLSAAIHLVAIFLLPLLLMSRGCAEREYGIPQGSGTPVIEVKVIRKVQKKPEKKFVLNMNTAISFYVPKIEESEILEEIDKQTENTYQAQQLGKLGAGGGKQGGWPQGMKNARVRFIRLEYNGGDWDQDMGVGADYNILLKFREKTGFDIATETESRPIPQLKRFPRNRAPPFVYLTGGLRGNMNISQSEIKVLREYCLEMGGLIFADNGGGRFDPQFRALMRRTFPDLSLVEIAKDDVLFQQPFFFPNGAPPLWHHSGHQAMGIKYKGRWVVFYHQGDINDAWKTGHSGASPAVAEQAYKLGVNIINYAFTQYMALNFGGVVPK